MDKCFQCGSDQVAERHPEIFECTKCYAREAHGERIPRIVVQPYQDEHGSLDWRFVVITFDDEHQFVMDRRHAKTVALNLDSVSHGGHIILP
jgi:hypothetical protein